MTDVEKLLKERDRIIHDIHSLENRLDGLDLAIRILKPEQVSVGGAKYGLVKNTVLDIIRQNKNVTAADIMDIAGRRGVKLNQKSIATLLSRLKGRGEIRHVDKYYMMN